MNSDPEAASGPLVSLAKQLARGDLLAAACPSREVLKHEPVAPAIGGVSERMLAQTLQWLEQDGLVERRALDVVPPHVEYRLTPLGLEAAEKVRMLTDWIETSLPAIAQNWRRSGRGS